MNVIITRDLVYSLSACVWNAIDKQYDILTVSVVNAGGELPGLTLQKEGERSQVETLPLALQKNSGVITLLQEGSLLTFFFQAMVA